MNLVKAAESKTNDFFATIVIKIMPLYENDAPSLLQLTLSFDKIFFVLCKYRVNSRLLPGGEGIWQTLNLLLNVLA